MSGIWEFAQQKGADIEFYQSNFEGDIVEKIQKDTGCLEEQISKAKPSMVAVAISQNLL